MVFYRHTQWGWWILSLLGSLIAAAIFISLYVAWHPLTLVPVSILVLCLPLFYSLTVTIQDFDFTCRFGIGLIQKTIPLKQIESMRAVQTRWYEGWGIHMTSTGWLWNISGWDAVELQLSASEIFKIGTHEPQTLMTAIAKAQQSMGKTV